MVSGPVGRVDNAACALYCELNKIREGRLLLTEFPTFGTQIQDDLGVKMWVNLEQ